MKARVKSTLDQVLTEQIARPSFSDDFRKKCFFAKKIIIIISYEYLVTALQQVFLLVYRKAKIEIPNTLSVGQ